MKEHILNRVQDLVSNFVYYDRKQDEDVNVDQLNEAFQDGTVTVYECVEHFRHHLQNTFDK